MLSSPVQSTDCLFENWANIYVPNINARKIKSTRGSSCSVLGSASRFSLLRGVLTGWKLLIIDNCCHSQPRILLPLGQLPRRSLSISDRVSVAFVCMILQQFNYQVLYSTKYRFANLTGILKKNTRPLLVLG